MSSTAAPDTSAPKKTTTTEEAPATTKKPPATSRLTTTSTEAVTTTSEATTPTTGAGVALTPAEREQLITQIMGQGGLTRSQATCYVDALVSSFTAAEITEYNRTKQFTPEQQVRITKILSDCMVTG